MTSCEREFATPSTTWLIIEDLICFVSSLWGFDVAGMSIMTGDKLVATWNSRSSHPKQNTFVVIASVPREIIISPVTQLIMGIPQCIVITVPRVFIEQNTIPPFQLLPARCERLRSGYSVLATSKNEIPTMWLSPSARLGDFFSVFPFSSCNDSLRG